MNDIDKIYVNLDDTNTRCLNVESSAGIIKQEVQYNSMSKNLSFGLAISGSNITVTPPSDSYISQYQQAIITATVSGLSNARAVVLYVSTPDYVQSSYDAEDYQYHFHLIPSSVVQNQYTLNITAAIRNEFVSMDSLNNVIIGSLQKCLYKFVIIDSSDEEYTQISSADNYISLYKTNTQDSYAPNDIDNMFIELDDINKRLSVLE